jgi:hypothetical protein
MWRWSCRVNPLASGDDGPLAYAEGLRIENADGAWQGEARGATLPDGTSWTGPLVVTGEAAYEGLTAVLLWTEDGCSLTSEASSSSSRILPFPRPPSRHGEQAPRAADETRMSPRRGLPM